MLLDITIMHRRDFCYLQVPPCVVKSRWSESGLGVEIVGLQRIDFKVCVGVLNWIMYEKQSLVWPSLDHN